MLTTKHTVVMTITTSTPSRDALMARLLKAQNHPRNAYQDILTITACRPAMTDEQLQQHVERYESYIAEWEAQEAAKGTRRPR